MIDQTRSFDQEATDEVVDECPQLYRKEVIESLIEYPPGTVVLLLTEYGMGRQALLNEYSRIMSECDWHVMVASSDSVGADSCLYRLSDMLDRCVRHCDETRRAGLIIFDDLPIGDEEYYESLVGIVRTGVRSGISFALGMLPEGEIVSEWLTEAVCLWSNDLLLKADSSEENGERWLKTRGIPSLASALRTLDGHMASEPLRASSFNEEYCRLVRWTQRDTLTREDRSICAVMLLLGYGTLAELREIVTVDDETWHGLARDEPILGIDERRASFSCVLGDSALAGHAVVRSLTGTHGRWTEYVASICRMLVGRGLYERAAIVSAASPDPDVRSRVALDYYFPFMNCGQVDIVLRAIRQGREGVCEAFAGYDESISVLSSLFYTGVKFEGNGAHRMFADSTEHSLYASLSCAVREVLRGEQVDEAFEVYPGGEKALRQLATHGRIMERLIAGDVEEAYLLAFGPDMYCEDESVIAALVTADRVALSTLVGSPLRASELLRLDRLMEFLKYALKTTRGKGKTPVLVVFLNAYVTCARVLAGVGADELELEVAWNLAASHGDTSLYGALMLTSAVIDLRSDVLVRAKSRLIVARRLFEDCGAELWSRASRLLLLTLSVHLHESVEADGFEDLKGISDEFDDIVDLVTRTLLTPTDERDVRRLPPAAPKSFLWLVDVLCTVFGEESLAIANQLPLSWRRARATLGSTASDLAGASGARMARLPEMCDNPPLYTDLGCAASDLVEIHLLGYPEVRVRGVAVPIAKLEQRKAKSLLALLAAIPAHALDRQKILDSIWPSIDFFKGSRAFANALTVLRSVLAVDPLDADGTVIIRSSKEGSGVALNMNHVTCDVDRLVELARQAIDAGNDHRRALRLAREVEDLYRGDLCVPPEDYAGIVQARKMEVRSIYVDALVCGARAAAHLSEGIIACRLARKAYCADRTREDVVQQLLEAYSVDGRFHEVKRLYDEYAALVAEQDRVTPSASLRRKYDRLLKDEGTEPVQEQTRIHSSLEGVCVRTEGSAGAADAAPGPTTSDYDGKG